MELKLCDRKLAIVKDSGSNCTFMELKLLSDQPPEVSSHCSNCTFMELKFFFLACNNSVK